MSIFPRAAMAPIARSASPNRPISSLSQTQALQKDHLCSVRDAARAAESVPSLAEHCSSSPPPIPRAPRPKSGHPITTLHSQTHPRRSRRISGRNAGIIDDAATDVPAEPSSVVAPPPASTEARAPKHRITPTPVPTLRLDTSYTNTNIDRRPATTDFELAQFLSPVPPTITPAAPPSTSSNDLTSAAQLQQSIDELFASTFSSSSNIQIQQQQQIKPISAFERYFYGLGIDPTTMPGFNDMVGKDDLDVCTFDYEWLSSVGSPDADADFAACSAQYLSDFFSTMPAAPVTAPSKPAISIPMSNAFHSLSPVESAYATPFSFDESDLPPPTDTPALMPDDDMLSAFTSPMWADMSLFPAPMPSQAQGLMPQTISPVELSQPLLTFEEDSIPVVDLEDVFARPAATPVQPSSAAERPKAQRKLSDSPAFDLDLSNDAFVVPAVPASASTSSLSSLSTGAGNKRKRSSATPAPSTSESGSGKRATFTGTRNSALPLLDADAPTQKRVYHGPPSKTSKRAIPASAARKVASLQQIAATGAVAAEDVEQEIEKSIEDKRRQNTVAARRSRQRKAEHLAHLEETVLTQGDLIERLREESEMWMQRALQAGWTE